MAEKAEKNGPWVRGLSDHFLPTTSTIIIRIIAQPRQIHIFTRCLPNAHTHTHAEEFWGVHKLYKRAVLLCYEKIFTLQPAPLPPPPDTQSHHRHTQTNNNQRWSLWMRKTGAKSILTRIDWADFREIWIACIRNTGYWIHISVLLLIIFVYQSNCKQGR